MKLTIFQADKGDCLLLTSGDGKHMLIDGGMRRSYIDHVAPTLSALQQQGERLDLLYVSHIDRDHVYGVLQLLEDLVAWRVHDFQLRRGNANHRAPEALRPPEINRIWHNAFHEILEKNSGPIASMLAATASVLAGGEFPDEEMRSLVEDRQELATSVGDAIQLSRLIGNKQLGIPLHPEYGGKLMFIQDNQPSTALGSVSLSVIGPFDVDLEKLRKEWNDWLKANETELKRIQALAKAVESQLANNEIGLVLEPNLIQAQELGQRNKVTAPNLASLMLLAEEGGQRILLTGDGHHGDILRGLKHHGKLQNGKLHVDVLKVQHHGSEHNIDPKFCKAVTADHYVFCANGAHENPDLAVVKAILASRKDDSRPYSFWFNSSSALLDAGPNRNHMVKVEKLVSKASTENSGRPALNFMQGSHLELALA